MESDDAFENSIFIAFSRSFFTGRVGRGSRNPLSFFSVMQGIPIAQSTAPLRLGGAFPDGGDARPFPTGFHLVDRMDYHQRERMLW